MVLNQTERARGGGAIYLRQWLAWSRAGEVVRKYEQLGIVGQVPGWALELAQWIALACCVKDAPQVVGRLVDWAAWVGASPRSVWTALEWLVREGIIVRRHFVDGRAAHEGSAGPAGRRLRECGYAPGPAMLAYFDEKRRRPRLPSVVVPWSHRLRSDSLGRSQCSGSTVDGAPARVMGGKERPSAASQLRGLGWAQERQRRRDDKLRAVLWVESRMHQCAARAALRSLPRPAGELQGAGLVTTGAADAQGGAVAPERPPGDRNPEGSGAAAPTLLERGEPATLEGVDLAQKFLRAIAVILGD